MKRNYFGVSIVGILCLLAAGCSSSNPKPATTPPGNSNGLQITMPAVSPSIDVGQSITVTANQAVIWSLQSGTNNAAAGTLSNTTTPSTSVTYTAPSTIPFPTRVSVIATLQSASTEEASLGIAINPLPTIIGNLSGSSSCQYVPGNTNTGVVGIPFPGASPSVSGGSGPYTWTVSSGSLPLGLALAWAPSLQSPSTAYLNGYPVSPGCSTLQLQVTDSTGAMATSQTAYIVITPPPLKIQIPNYPDAYSGSPYPPTALSVSGGIPPYQWSVPNVASLPPGINVNPSPSNSGTAVITGTPNGSDSETNGGPYTPQIQVTDNQQPYPAFGTVSLNIYQWASPLSSACSPAQNANGTANITTNLSGMNGSYAFLLRGFDGNGPVVIAGSFTTDGAGNITGGIEDATRVVGSQAAVAIIGGSYSIVEQNTASGSNVFNQSGCVMLTTSTGTNTFAISLGGCSTSAGPTSGACVADSQGNAGIYTTGRMIEFDDSTGSGTRATGIVRLQNNSALSAGPSGSYAFGLSGFDFAGSRFAAAGSFKASSTSLTSVAADVNDGGALQTALTGGSGTYTPGSNGRGTLTLTQGAESINLVSYTVSAQEVLLASTGAPSSTNPTVGGEAISATGPFSTASLENSHMFHIAGLAATGPDPSIGILSFDGVGGVTGTQYEDQAGTLGTTSLSGSYAVNSMSGRLSFVPSTTNQQSLGDHPLVGYVVPVPDTLTRQNCVQLSSCVTGFLLSTDASVQAGQLEFQTPAFAPPPPFSSLYVSGYYFFGTDESLDSSTPLFAGAAQANPNHTVYAGIESASYPNSTYCEQPGCALLIPNETIASGGAYSVNSNGTATVGGNTVAVTNGNVIYYIDESPMNSHPSVMVVEQ